ncbi:DUF2243 domain-containing protein [Haloarcula onubensis]|uniref:DUF2243 domain-containing protein n=1 Tax=Haloarcula onubensis TaxID=2950539 RepID=A0ABU2FRB4_9EURY|nr:DUF2243 domain-containing protein [Halomicroarcula sp. S3CR25-11]MDS0283303.1 DUF2243 domain-containing protein [Halomicroarcula sp. S3CR25-11]
MSQPNAARSSARTTSGRGLVGAGVFGLGFSGLVDVLVLHHVLQWHHLVSGVYPMDTLAGLRTNILADGLFSLGMLLIASVGAGLLWRAERAANSPLAVRPLAGAALVGLGVFDIFDAVVDHVLLGLHQPLSQGGQYNPHWLVVSLLFVAAGYYVYRTGRSTDAEAQSSD